MSEPLPFHVADLERFLRDRGLCSGPITVRRVGHGSSTLTYVVHDGHRRVVLRRPPPPPLPPGDHDVLREARFQRALADTPVPVPTVLATAEAGAVMESPCYVMTHVDGIVATTETPPVIDTPSHRRALAETMVDTLAELHGLDVGATGLLDLVEPEGDYGSHLRRFARTGEPQQELPGELAGVLKRLLGDPPQPTPARIVHGDYRLGNLVLAPHAPPQILAVLDWELATVGDPLRDLGYFLATYAVRGEPLHPLTALSSATLAEGYPERRELAERYARITGRDLSRLDWYVAMALWKLAVVFAHQRRSLTQGADSHLARLELVEELLSVARRA